MNTNRVIQTLQLFEAMTKEGLVDIHDLEAARQDLLDAQMCVRIMGRLMNAADHMAAMLPELGAAVNEVSGMRPMKEGQRARKPLRQTRPVADGAANQQPPDAS